MFGMLKDGKLIAAPSQVRHNGYVYFNPTAGVYLAAGYLPVEDTPLPEVAEGESASFVSRYEEQDGKIVRIWEQAEPPVPVVLPYNERVVARIREVYSVDDEIALLRQRDAKPEEFAQYNAYVEQIKDEERQRTEMR